MARRVDANQAAIVLALRQVGASVQHLHTVGQGAPDILCGFRGANYLMEIKNPGVDAAHRRLTVSETAWHQGWGGQIAIVYTIEDALRVIGATE
jgi:hypothetical protein